LACCQRARQLHRKWSCSLRHRPPSRTAPRVIAIPALTRSRPVQLTIPAIGVTTSVGTLGLQADDQVMVPTNTTTVGWYIDGAAPGQIGSAVILGHRGLVLGPGGLPFCSRRSSPVTASIWYWPTGRDQLCRDQSGGVLQDDVSRSTGLRLTRHPVAPVGDVRWGVSTHATGHYESNVVVYSQLVSASPVTS